MTPRPILPDELRRAPWVQGGRDASGLDCLGVVLAVAQRLGLNLVDPWAHAEHTGFPADWARISGLDAVEPRTGDVWLWHSPRPHVGIVVDGVIVTSRERQGVVAMPPMRCKPPDEVWRRQPC